MKTRRTLVALFAALAVLAAACSSSTESAAPETTTSSFDMPDLVFGRGELPPSVPSPWPMPDQSIIGATMMDGTRMITEVVITYPATVSDVAAYYTTNLVTLGYEVSNGSGTDGAFMMDFSGHGVTGTISLATSGTGLTAGTIQFFHG